MSLQITRHAGGRLLVWAMTRAPPTLGSVLPVSECAAAQPAFRRRRDGRGAATRRGTAVAA